MDHPRRRGEKFDELHHCIYLSGSPPQVRGKAQPSIRTNCWRWITPAGAGKSLTNSITAYTSLDHPRRCGEKGRGEAQRTARGGSPPQVRGKDAGSIPHTKRLRITPAGAGKRAIGREGGCGNWDHPRRCGEKLSGWIARWQMKGSPPQVRGKGRVIF